MWFLLLSLASAGPPPISAPCCGAKPVQHSPTDQISVAPPEPPSEPRELLALVSYRVGPGTVRQSVCDSVRFCGEIQCDREADEVYRRRSWQSDLHPLSTGASLRVEAFGMGTFVCSVDRWAAVVDGPKGTSWVALTDGGGGTKGGTGTQLKQLAPLGKDRFWVEIQHDRQHTMSPREVVLYGFVVGLHDTEPVVLASKIPVWVDGEQYAGPRQIDVAVDGDTLKITPRTELVSPEQAKWLGSWTLEGVPAPVPPE